jgi:hypothetical protein
VPAANSVFISYRREPGYASAKLIWHGLRDLGIDAFLDLESLVEAGAFDVKVLNQIAGRPYFVIVLTEGTLDRCRVDGDWLWRELDHALQKRRIIVPAIIPPFDFTDADRYLPSTRAASTLKASQGVSFPPEYFDDAVERLADRLRPVQLRGRSLSVDDHEFARRAATLAEQGPDQPAAPFAPSAPPASVPVASPVEPADEKSWRDRWPLGVAAIAAACLVVVLAVIAPRAVGDDDDSPAPDTTVEQVEERFDAALGVPVEPGDPGPGAGEIDASGQVDVYAFDGQSGDDVFVDMLAINGVTCGTGAVEDVELDYALEDPDGVALVFGGYNFVPLAGCLDGGPVRLPVDGRYELRVGPLSTDVPTDDTVTYSIAVLPARREEFELALDVPVEPGAPGQGAGEIGSPGQVDVYTFDGAAGDDVFVEMLAFDGVSCGTGGMADTALAYELNAPDGAPLLAVQQTPLVSSGCVDAGPIELPIDGRYELQVGALSTVTDATATYSIAVRSAPREEFEVALGVPVGPDVPGPGAGEIGSPGQVDVYSFDGAAGDYEFVDMQAFNGVTCGAGRVEDTDLVYRLEAPDGEQLVSDRYNPLVSSGCVDEGPIELPIDGRYELQVGALATVTDATATYSIAVEPAPPEQFELTLGVPVEPDVPGPGAGEIGSPGQIDVYTFDGAAGDEVDIELLAFDGVPCGSDRLTGRETKLAYELIAPDGASLVGDDHELVSTTGCGHAGPIELPLDGRYELEVGSVSTSTDATATYSIEVSNQ